MIIMSNNVNLNETSSASQKRRILEYLKEGNGITSLDALRLFDCLRLASRINDLRNDGWDIKTEMVTDNRSGKRYARYTLEGYILLNDLF